MKFKDYINENKQKIKNLESELLYQKTMLGQSKKGTVNYNTWNAAVKATEKKLKELRGK